MPIYTYRREDGTTFNIKQKFADDPLTVDPETGQKVVRVVQPTGIIFKGSGFYVNDSRSDSHRNGRSNGSNGSSAKAAADTAEKSSEKPSDNKSSETASAD